MISISHVHTLLFYLQLVSVSCFTARSILLTNNACRLTSIHPTAAAKANVNLNVNAKARQEQHYDYAARLGRKGGYPYRLKLSKEYVNEKNDVIVPGLPSWQQTMLRISNPSKSVEFYKDIMGMTLIDTLDFPQWEFKLFFLTTLPKGETYDLVPGTKEAHDYMWSIGGTALELTYNYGTDDESSSFEGYHPGNKENDGFGHVAFSTNDVYASCDKLESAGVLFQKKPNEGRMKGLAFALDPDGYWVEIVKRAQGNTIDNEFNFSQTMLRVKDPKKSVKFYEALGMKLVYSMVFDDFSLYYLASNVEESFDLNESSDEEARVKLGSRFGPVFELTHNHGTENDEDFKHYNGNEEGRQGFGHIGFLVDDVYEACDSIREMGYGFKKEPDGGAMKGLAFAYDPDGYAVEIIKRGGIEFGDKIVNSAE